MARQAHRRRRSKVVTGGHDTMLPGLRPLVARLEKWDEISQIRTGRLTSRRGNRSSFQFRATRLARIGDVIVGIKCHAIDGTGSQEVVLQSDNLPRLTRRLVAEGYAKSSTDGLA